MPKYLALVMMIALSLSAPTWAEDKPGAIAWQDWSDTAFETAKREHKLVILDMEAVWCHWCHVMNQTTYLDPDVITQMKDHYIAVRVDQDSHPDLSHRYDRYGWPATIIFAADGTEIVKRRGYIEPEVMKVVLKESFENPTPNPNQTASYEPSSNAGLTDAQREEIFASLVYFYDKENAGWGDQHKFLEPQMMQFAFNKALLDNRVFRVAATRTLEASTNLIDPVWGGVYQYSDSLDWKSPHFEKIISFQSGYIQSYAYGYEVFHEQKYRDAAYNVLKYVDAFLTGKDGQFYTSQDADLSEKITGHDYYKLDDKGRRALGMPRIDTHSYSDENGHMISALTVLYAATGNKTVLARAQKAMHWLLTHRARKEGGFAHGDADKGGPFLVDTLSVARAMLDVYGVTGDRDWLKKAQENGDFIAKNFIDSKGGFLTAPARTGDTLKPYKQLDDNIGAARFFNLLSYYSGQKSYKENATSAMRYLASPELVAQATFSPGTLLADDENRKAPLHLTIVGAKKDPKAVALFAAAIALPPLYKRTEWYDKAEGKLPGSDIEFPELAAPAAFICTERSCSLPIMDAKALADEVDRRIANP